MDAFWPELMLTLLLAFAFRRYPRQIDANLAPFGAVLLIAVREFTVDA